ncbi:hypothetical protein BASA61_003571 [Batrachochytrium salamandrivorans]|nr:hypothetical protein BASA61_003571 [Batrachochytrium salamandrivorans]
MISALGDPNNPPTPVLLLLLHSKKPFVSTLKLRLHFTRVLVFLNPFCHSHSQLTLKQPLNIYSSIFKMISTAVATIVFCAAIASAQDVCKPDLLIDDFSTSVSANVDGAIRPVNHLGADYGEVNVTWSINTAEKFAMLSPSSLPNFWYSKFDARACFDLTGYSSIDFDLVAPTGSDMSFTLTQKAPNCVDRLVDSTYLSLTKYIKPDGTKQHVSLPLGDFATNINGLPFDFIHLKDWTPTGLSPVGAVFHMSNLVLKGGCGVPKPGGNPNPNSSSAAVTGTAAATTTAVATGAATTTAAGTGAATTTASGTGSTGATTPGAVLPKSGAESVSMFSALVGSIVAAIAGVALF